jgi:TP901 family phage tail tape measure protein
VDKTDPGVSNATKKLGSLGDAADAAGQSIDRSREYVSKFDEQANKTQMNLAKWAKEKYQIYLEAKENISPVLDTIGGGVKSLAGKTWSFTLKALDFATTPVRTLLNLLKNPLLQAGAFFGVSLGLTDTINTQKDFEAAMSQVQATSGADADEMERLTKKAEEMGATTKFTASDSAEAMNYMAMAGWKTEDMLDGITGIMNLAAAANEDLGTTSDIVTDALTAFGLSASDSGHFADVLAQASANANTNVSMLGESFKYVAPVAGAMKYSVEDVSLALGLMANASVKGSQAGTSLKTSIANMAAPTDKMQGAMDKYGISLTKRNGEMKSFKEVLDMLRANLGGLSETEQTAAASTIFGKEAMAGMLAIINASTEDYEKLTQAIYNADGATEKMANTQLDNLSGSITLLQSAVDGVKISFGKRLNPYVRSVAEGLTAAMPDIEVALSDFMDFVDRKYDVMQAKMQKLTASDEWQNADFGGRVKLAWDEIVSEPFKEWWGSTGKSIVSNIAGDVGRGIGSGIGAGLMMLLGIDVSDSVNEGESVGKAFAKGFSDGFDFDAIKDGLFSGIGNLFSSAGKLLPGGKSADLGSVVSAAIIAKAAMPAVSVGKDVWTIGKGIFGAQDSLGGASLVGTIAGSTGNAMVAGTGVLGSLANVGYAVGGGSKAGLYFGNSAGALPGGMAALEGAGAVAGAVTAGATLISAGIDAYTAMKSSDKDKQAAYGQSAAWKAGGVATGTAAGAMLGSFIPGVGTVVGGLVGAGIGGLTGYVEGKRIKKEYQESAEAEALTNEKLQKVYEITGSSTDSVNFKTKSLTEALKDTTVTTEEFNTMLQRAVSDDLIEHFGSLHLSLTEIKDVASSIAFNGMESQFDDYAKSVESAANSLSSVKSAFSDLKKENWKLSLGAPVTEADVKEYRSSIDQMLSSTASYLQDKHYEANLAFKLIMGEDANTDGLDATYSAIDAQLDELKEKLNTAIDANIKLNGGVLKLDSDSEILSLQQQIQDITNQVSTAQENAKFDALKIKYGGAALDSESFASLQEELKNTVSSMTSQYDDALEVNLTNLRLQLDRGDIDQDKFNRQLQALTDGYNAQVSDLQVRVESFQLDSIAEAYSSALDGILPDLKGTTSEKLQQAMDAALKEKPNVADWTNSDVVEWFDLNGMDAETQAALVQLLKSVADSMPASFADSIRNSGLSNATRDAAQNEIDAAFKDDFNTEAKINVTERIKLNGGVASSYAASSGVVTTTPSGSGSGSRLPYAARNNSIMAGGSGVFPSSPSNISGHATGGMVNGRELSWVGEEGPEMIIPLVPARRERAVELYQQAGEILGVTAHANGGLVGSGSSSYISPVTGNYTDSYYDGHTSRHNEFSSDTVDYLSQTVNEAPVSSNLFSDDDSTTFTSSSTQNVASTSQNVTVRPEVTVKVDVNPEFNITGGEKSEDEIMAVIRRHMKEMADEIGGELATKLDEVFSNMPLKGVNA